MGILSAVTALTFARALDAAAEMALPTLEVRSGREHMDAVEKVERENFKQAPH